MKNITTALLILLVGITSYAQTVNFKKDYNSAKARLEYNVDPVEKTIGFTYKPPRKSWKFAGISPWVVGHTTSKTYDLGYMVQWNTHNHFDLISTKELAKAVLYNDSTIYLKVVSRNHRVLEGGKVSRFTAYLSFQSYEDFQAVQQHHIKILRVYTLSSYVDRWDSSEEDKPKNMDIFNTVQATFDVSILDKDLREGDGYIYYDSEKIAQMTQK